MTTDSQQKVMNFFKEKKVGSFFIKDIANSICLSESQTRQAVNWLISSGVLEHGESINGKSRYKLKRDGSFVESYQFPVYVPPAKKVVRRDETYFWDNVKSSGIL